MKKYKKKNNKFQNDPVLERMLFTVLAAKAGRPVIAVMWLSH